MTPTLLTFRLSARLTGWKSRLRDRLRGETRATFFDAYSADELNEVLRECGREPLAPPDPASVTSPAFAARFVAASLAYGRAKLRPDLASACERLAKRYGLTPKASALVRGVPASSRAWKAALAYQFRPDIRDAIPLGLTPAQRRNLLAWLLRYGAADVGLSDEDVLLGTLLAASDPSHGLRETYLLRPEWQAAVPDALTPHNWPALRRWVADEYNLTSRWVRAAKLPAVPPSPPADVLAVGLFRYSSGLQQAGVGMVRSLRAAGVRVACRDLPGAALRENPPGEPLDALPNAPVAVFNLGLDTSVPEAARRTGVYLPPHVRRVAVWWWELEDVPTEWRDRGSGVDEIWAPTRFVADALRVLGKPVFPMLPGVEPPRPGAATKADFGMSSRKWTIVALFDANSRLARKNPQGAVRAFRAAFGPAHPVELILKMTPPVGGDSDELRELRRECAAAGVRLLEEHYPRGKALAFLAAADALVSLHRSEGLGLPLAEAMLLGKPVVATGYSGNLDFMTPDNSLLVPYTRAPIEDDALPYRKGMVWAEPSVEAAAEAMRKLAGDPQSARRLGQRAKEEAAARLCPRAAGERMRARLAELAAHRA